MKRLQYLIFLFYFIWIATQHATADSKIYRWQDEKGNVHFSERKPTSAESESIKVKNKASSDAPKLIDALNKKREENIEASKAKKDRKPTTTKKASKAQCDQAKRNLQSLGLATRIKTRDPDTDEVTFLNDKMRNNERQKNQDFLDQYCSKP